MRLRLSQPPAGNGLGLGLSLAKGYVTIAFASLKNLKGKADIGPYLNL